MELLFLDALTDKNSLHSYKTVYDRYISGRKKVLEIGIQRGGSILTWAATGAEVWAIDINPPPAFLSHPRIHIGRGNAYDKKAIEALGDNKFDMIVEDGSHTPEDILWAAKHYTGLLSEKGVMIIEDIPNDAVVSQLKMIPGFFTVEFDLRSVKGRYDDRIVVLERIPK